MKPRLYNTQGCPYAWRTRLVLHEKQVDFDVHEVDLSNKSEEFLSISPYGKVPVFAVNGKPNIPAKQRMRQFITSDSGSVSPGSDPGRAATQQCGDPLPRSNRYLVARDPFDRSAWQ